MASGWHSTPPPVPPTQSSVPIEVYRVAKSREDKARLLYEGGNIYKSWWALSEGEKDTWRLAAENGEQDDN